MPITSKLTHLIFIYLENTRIIANNMWLVSDPVFIGNSVCDLFNKNKTQNLIIHVHVEV